MRRNHIAVALLIVLLLMLGGCSQPAEPATEPTQPAATADQLVGVTWNCFEFNVADSPQTVPESPPITAEFKADGTLSGNSGVNTYSTTYTTDGDKITISDKIVSTMMAGPEADMKRESDYLVTLPTAVRFNFSKDGGLILLGPADNAIARYNPPAE